MINILRGLFKKFNGETVCTHESASDNNYTKQASVSLRFEEEAISPHIQHYGLTSRPPEGTEAVFLRDGRLSVIIGEDDGDNRPLIEEHEVCLYTDKTHYIKIDKLGNLIIHCPGQKVGLSNGNSKVVLTQDDVTVHSSGPVRLDSNQRVIIGNGGGYVVTSPTSGPVADVSQLTAQSNVMA
jgi:phage gp45-like